MRATLLSRLKRLESTIAVSLPAVFRYGWLRSLPSDFTGESYVAIVKREPTTSPNIEVCEFEERPGPAPANCTDESFSVCLTR